MKKKKFCAYIITALIIASLFAIPSSAKEYVSVEIPEKESSETTDSMTTERYNVEMNVSENNTIEVVEQITVNFTDETHHGIYRYIPYKGKIFRSTQTGSAEENYRIKISDVKVNGYNFEKSYENGCLVMKIGDEDKIVTGEHRYVISYLCTLYDDKISSQDMLYWNFIPFSWNTSIASSSLTLNMPKEFDTKKAEILSGYIHENLTDKYNVSFDGNTLKASSKDGLEVNQGATVNISLPEGYFTNEKTYDNLLYILAAIVGASFAIMFILWLLFGRDRKIIPIISFYPPENMSSAEIGYIIDGKVDNKDIVSLIIYWADKRYVKIIETDKKNFRLCKLKDLPSDAEDYQKTLFDGLFNGRSEVDSTELKGSFYNTFSTAKNQLFNHFVTLKGNNLYTVKSVVSRIIAYILVLVPITTAVIGGLYMIVADSLWYVFSAVLLVMFLLSLLSAATNYDRKNGMTKGKYLFKIVFSSVVGAISLALLGLIGVFRTDMEWLTLIAVAFSAIGYFLTIRMKTLTKQGVKWRGEVIGFKNFIYTAELDRIKTLVDENPEYFYNILPYAYALGITDKWSKKFESIAVPEPVWYNSPYAGNTFGTMIFLSSFDRCMSDFDTNMHSMPENMSVSSGDFSGGFSSGGGFSGGGFGGGGGGSW